MVDGFVRPKTLIMFGAGASAFSEPSGEPCPPLGKDLMKKLPQSGKAVSQIAFNPDYQDMFKYRGFEFAIGYAASDSCLSRNFLPVFQKEIGLYLNSFTPSDKNLYVSLLNQIELAPDKVGFVSLNYDLLLERALEYSNVDYCINVDNLDISKISVLKPHGSPSFVPPDLLEMNGNTIRTIGAMISGLPTTVLSDKDEIDDWLSKPENLDKSPVMSYYSSGKFSMLNQDYLEKIREIWTEQVSAADNLIIIGVKHTPEDKHLWEPIERSACQIMIVDPFKPNVELFKERFGDRVSALGSTFEDCIPLIKELTTDY